MSGSRFAGLLVAAAVMPGVAGAQALPRLVPAAASALRGPATDSVRQSPPSGSVMGAVLGGAIGAGIGGFLGYWLDRGPKCRGDFCGLAGFIYGGLAGETVGVALGAHGGNARRGNLAAGVAASAAAMVLGIVVANATDMPGEFVLFIPAIQIAAVTSVEVATGRGRGGT